MTHGLGVKKTRLLYTEVQATLHVGNTQNTARSQYTSEVCKGSYGRYSKAYAQLRIQKIRMYHIGTKNIKNVLENTQQ